EQGLARGPEFTVETIAGVIRTYIVNHSSRVTMVKVDMGEPVLHREHIPMLGGKGYALDESISIEGKMFHYSAVNVGVPHAVVYVNDLDKTDVGYWGPRIETNRLFPKHINVDFTQIMDRKTLRVRTWERGVGETLSCGTGCAAAMLAAFLTHKTQPEVDVALKLGSLHIEFNGSNIFMTGPAESIFVGQASL
ncbi:diaminopimelate epimerase, partial [Clostridia bacterium OttesenSCG-928-F22]|nr:diaminopimelate epimerase [Clostridia bacterium OttesenSCG-928-F22]